MPFRRFRSGVPREQRIEDRTYYVVLVERVGGVYDLYLPGVICSEACVPPWGVFRGM